VAVDGARPRLPRLACTFPDRKDPAAKMPAPGAVQCASVPVSGGPCLRDATSIPYHGSRAEIVHVSCAPLAADIYAAPVTWVGGFSWA
jgi:hypothetical protein